jgi:hypothetical protein
MEREIERGIWKTRCDLWYGIRLSSCGRTLRTFEPSDEERYQDDGGNHDYSILDWRAENNPVSIQPAVNLIAHDGPFAGIAGEAKQSRATRAGLLRSLRAPL